MRTWVAVVLATLLHAALLAGGRGCRVQPDAQRVDVAVITVAPPPPPPAPEPAPPPIVQPVPVQPTPPRPRRPRPPAPRPVTPEPPGPAEAAPIPAPATEGTGELVASLGGLGEGAGGGGPGGFGPPGATGSGEPGPPLPTGCRAEDFRGIFLVDGADRLIAFDPPSGRFRLIGLMRCKPRAPYEKYTDEWDAHPFSMAVDRKGRAWVLYSSGELFHVDTTTGACRPTRWVPGRSGYELFGMGFVADADGRERLYIAGGSISQLDRADGRVALLDMASLEPTSLGSHPRGNHSPELSGTADGRLFAFYPGEKLTHLDVAGGRGLSSWRLPRGAGGRVKAWAFAHWGGAFYLFATESLGSFGGEQRNRVYRFDPASGALGVVVGASPYQITGAGVSTCAPTR